MHELPSLLKSVNSLQSSMPRAFSRTFLAIVVLMTFAGCEPMSGDAQDRTPSVTSTRSSPLSTPIRRGFGL